MKALHSSKSLKRALGLGLLGLMLSVPAGQASASITLTDLNTSDNMSLVPNPTVSATSDLNVVESYGDQTSILVPYANSYGFGGGYAAIDPSGSYFDKEAVISGDGAGNDTWQAVITNNTLYTWADYHFEFYEDSAFLNPVSSISYQSAGTDKFGNQLVTGNVMSFWAANASEVVKPGETLTVTMVGDLSTQLGGSDGTMYIRQVATIVPEPGSLSLIGVGLAGLLGYRRKMAKA